MLSFDHIKQIKISLMSINKAYFALRWGWQRCMVWLSLCLATLSSAAACLGDAKATRVFSMAVVPQLAPVLT